MIGAVVLAAGAGRRMGGVAKALLPAGETTFLGSIVRAMAAAGVDPAAIVIVVGPPYGAAVAREAARLALADAIAWNDDPDRGMASSVAIGFAAVAASACDAALLWPVDHARVRSATIEALDDALADHDAAIPVYAGATRGRAEPEGRRPGAAPRAPAGIDQRGGHPTLIARALFAKLAACADDADGARGVLRAARVIRVPTDDAGVIHDVDTPEELA